MAQLDEAVLAYRAASDAVSSVLAENEAKLKAARIRAEEARTALYEAIAQAARGGVRQVDIIRVTGYSRERVRTILRTMGVEAE